MVRSHKRKILFLACGHLHFMLRMSPCTNASAREFPSAPARNPCLGYSSATQESCDENPFARSASPKRRSDFCTCRQRLSQAVWSAVVSTRYRTKDLVPQPSGAGFANRFTAAFVESLKTVAYWLMLTFRRGRPRANSLIRLVR